MVMQQLRHVNVDKIIDFMDNFISIASAFINFYFESKVEIEGVKWNLIHNHGAIIDKAPHSNYTSCHMEPEMIIGRVCRWLLRS